MKTLTNYIFCESSIIEDYHTVFMPLKCRDRFAKVHALQYLVPVQSEVIKRN